MSIKELMPLILSVLKDFRVIITIVAMVFVIEFAKYITTYTKKPPKPKKKKTVAPPPAEQKPEEKKEGEQEAPAQESSSEAEKTE